MPLVSLAILFFFLNHGVESTIYPLELVFEHRNYLPSFFLFLPLAHAMVRLNRHSFFSKKYGRYVAVAAVCIPVGLLCNWTFARNMVWRSEKSLWEDEIAKNPKLARPYHNLAWGYYQARGQYEEALSLYQKALSLKAHTPFEVSITLSNMGRIYYLLGDYEHALYVFLKSIDDHPLPQIVNYQVVMTLIQLGRWQEAMQQIDSALQGNRLNPSYLKLKGIILSKTGDHEGSISLLYRSLNQQPEAVDTRTHLSIMLARMGRFDEAALLLAGNGATYATNALIVMAQSEIELLKGNIKASNDHFINFIHHQGVEKGREILLSGKEDPLAINIDYDYYLGKIDQLGRK